MQRHRSPARQSICQTRCALTDDVSIQSFSTDSAAVQLAWDIDRYSDAIGVGNTGQNVNLEAQLKARWPPLLPDATMVLDEPCVLIDQHSRILAWVLPGVLHVDRQVSTFRRHCAMGSFCPACREKSNWQRRIYPRSSCVNRQGEAGETMTRISVTHPYAPYRQGLSICLRHGMPSVTPYARDSFSAMSRQWSLTHLERVGPHVTFGEPAREGWRERMAMVDRHP